MSSPSLARGSLSGILEFLVYKRKKPLGILDLVLGILDFLGVKGCLFLEF